MTKAWRALLAFLLCACWSASAPAHRLDEYLHATMVSVERDHVVLQLRLTPGVEVAGAILADIDTDGDGVLSEVEQRAYAEQVAGELALDIDGHPLSLRLVSSAYAPVEAIRWGLGDIAFALRAELSSSDGDYRLTLEQRHPSARVVYLVNALMPSDPAVHIRGQQRSSDQSSYRLDFTVGGASVLGAGMEQRQPVIGTFFWHGVHHILTGYDHLLFATALALAAATFWKLLKVVTAFTLAHSITLTLAALGWVHLPAMVVEPLIATSIVVVALQNLFWPASTHGRARLAVAFCFGLFHGLGFAGGLLDLMQQMPKETILYALLGFSLGVELGHQVLLLPLFVLLKVTHSQFLGNARQTRLSMALRRFGSGGVALAGLYYLSAALAGNA
ncbi:hypothetical protein DNK06_14180 [Pseudomonas daroniae]|uniref:HupE/UreJ family protein n=1 Tax=Phytopseudomonas daroniae TaxID=2487519 RepID=A0A4Q9QMK6_9GAMM|nr:MULTISPECIES: HupE/UreJ family protein [Pseudomonas]TBU77962.1 hypothetical protein DNK06_14180 [Pseudomonas daroniae]TBU82310.1 hypothetical protein DNK31_12820 [Pseudomonas sp. FRB 228]TBU91063.1 hypothetical protein DNJ99_11405 [Pseudomonas daroniae]